MAWQRGRRRCQLRRLRLARGAAPSGGSSGGTSEGRDDAEEQRKYLILGFFALFWTFILAREVAKFQAALEQGPLATQQFLGVFVLKFLAGVAFTVIQVYMISAFPGPARDKDGLPTWDEIWDSKSDYWNRPVAFPPQLVALALVGSVVTYFAAYNLLSVGVQAVKELAVQNLPDVGSLDAAA